LVRLRFICALICGVSAFAFLVIGIGYFRQTNYPWWSEIPPIAGISITVFARRKIASFVEWLDDLAPPKLSMW